MMYSGLDCKANPEKLAITNRCRLLLIEAGADPTLSAGSMYHSFIGDMLDVGTTVFLVTLYR